MGFDDDSTKQIKESLDAIGETLRQSGAVLWPFYDLLRNTNAYPVENTTYHLFITDAGAVVDDVVKRTPVDLSLVHEVLSKQEPSYTTPDIIAMLDTLHTNIKAQDAAYDGIKFNGSIPAEFSCLLFYSDNDF